jgi:hypothetical protein
MGYTLRNPMKFELGPIETAYVPAAALSLSR